MKLINKKKKIYFMKFATIGGAKRGYGVWNGRKPRFKHFDKKSTAMKYVRRLEK